MKKHILIVDDEELLLEITEDIIKNLDGEFEAHTAINGKQALELINQFNMELLITDMFMPDMDGLALIREVQKKQPSIKIIAMSGDAIHGNINYLKVAGTFGASCRLNKPFTKDELLSAIYRVL